MQKGECTAKMGWKKNGERGKKAFEWREEIRVMIRNLFEVDSVGFADCGAGRL